MSTPLLPPISQEQMIAHAVGATNVDHNKAKFANFCNKIGLLQFRVVRYLFGINLNGFTQKIQAVASKLSNLNDAREVKKVFDDLLNKKWVVKNSKEFQIQIAVENLAREPRTSTPGSPEAPLTTDGSSISSPSFETVAMRISENSVAKWNEIMNTERDGIKKTSNSHSDQQREVILKNRAISTFSQHINKELTDAGFSLSLISDNPNILTLFLQNDQLRPALAYYAQTHPYIKNSTKILNEHLIFVAQQIFNNRKTYISDQKLQQLTSNPDLVTEAMCKINDEFLQGEYRSLSEVLENPEAMDIFKQSERLKLVLNSYQARSEARFKTFIANDLNKKSAKYWKEAIASAEANLQKQSNYLALSKEDKQKTINDMAMNIFIIKIQIQLKAAELDLSQISDNPNILTLFLENDQLRPALVFYAKNSDPQKMEILNQHLIFLTSRIVQDMREKISTAFQNENYQDIITIFQTIRARFKQEGRSLQEIFTNQEDKNIFSGIKELNVLLLLYERMIKKPKDSTQPQTDNMPKSSNQEEGGARTVLMRDFLEQLVPRNTRQISVNSVNYTVISSEVSDFNTPIVSCGSSASREFILLDPSHSPQLNAKYDQFKAFVNQSVQQRRIDEPGYQLCPQKLSLLVNTFVRTHVFPHEQSGNGVRNDIEERVTTFVNEKTNDPTIQKIPNKKKEIPCIPIDQFIEAKVGVCRHHSLVTAFMLDRFIREHQATLAFQGKVQVMRDNLTNQRGQVTGAHAWVTLVTDKDDICAIDTLNDCVAEIGKKIELHQPEGSGARSKKDLEQVFGQTAIENQIRKARALAKGIKRS